MERWILSRPDWIALSELNVTAALREKLRTAVVVRPELVPRGVVTLGSRFVCIDEERAEREILTLAHPSEAFRGPARVSVLAPLGTAVLGASSGQAVSAAGRRVRIGPVLYQPERARYVAAPMAP